MMGSDAKGAATALTIAIVGFGSAGVRALTVLRELRPDAEFLVVSQNAQAKKDVTITSSFDDVAALNPDAVILAGPSTTRADALRQLGALHVPVFFEKPLAHTLEAALELLNLLGPGRERSQLGYNLRFSKSLIAFRDLVRGGLYGRVIRFSAETAQYLPDWRPGRDYRETVSARADLGGGVLLELSHELDYLRWIFGEWEWVSAWTGKTSSLEIDVEDSALVTIGIDSTYRGAQLVGQLSLDFARRDKSRCIIAVCEGGTLRWDGITGILEVYRPSESRWLTVMTELVPSSTHQAQWGSFLSVVEEGAAPSVGVAEGVEVLRAIEAIRQSSAQSGSRVYLRTVEVSS